MVTKNINNEGIKCFCLGKGETEIPFIYTIYLHFFSYPSFSIQETVNIYESCLVG